MKRDFDSRNKECGCNLRISLGLVGVIESIRSILKKRVEILTGFYCPSCGINDKSHKRNYHCSGVAADIRVESVENTELFLLAELHPEVKGIGINLDDSYVHIDTRKEDVRELWVEKDNTVIQITEENRHEYIPKELQSPFSVEPIPSDYLLSTLPTLPISLPSEE